ncbi:hypothetical protein PLICRDRAFT_175553 [Plicaturopsis crispa FD-325 SS-3]|nr:hypothetical protein PLICRDRAFT_175553 [Plicaturopsis crispa FD-325 SS-3]
MSALSPTSSSSSSASSSSARSQLSNLSSSSLASTFFDESPPTSPPTSSKTDAFFSSSYETSPPPRKMPSLNTDFFAIPSPIDARPTPPPSIYNPSRPASRSRSPPHLLSRLFPSRHTSIRHGEVAPDLDRTPSPISPIDRRSPVPPSESEITPRPPDVKPAFVLGPGTVIADPDPPLTLKLIRVLGQGTFSAVWLAAADALPSRPRRMRRKTVTPLDGTRPVIKARDKERNPGLERNASVGSARSVYLDERDGDGPCESVVVRPESGNGRLVAVKMTSRSDNRTRVSFVREVEVLRHISHPMIVAHLAAFTSPTHHVLVLEHLPGGELFDLVNADAAHANLGEHTVRRMWSELCKAVAWMHGVGLVHRDIKLENILLTTAPSDPVPPPPYPLIKLTDFGLARFIDPAAPQLTTRCGSESYAAPELVIPGQPYDGRETDAWACGVVLYAMATRRLPFGEDVHDHDGVQREDAGTGRGRRRWLMRIAKGEYTWPQDVDSPWSNPLSTDAELYGTDMGLSAGLRRVVDRLLQRDTSRRARVRDVLAEEWTGGVQEESKKVVPVMAKDVDGDSAHGEIADQQEEEEGEVDGNGHIVDRAGIASIACEEIH